MIRVGIGHDTHRLAEDRPLILGSLRIDSPTVPVVVGTVPAVGRLSVLLQRGWLRLLIVALTVIFGAVATKRLVQSMRHPDPTDNEDNR